MKVEKSFVAEVFLLFCFLAVLVAVLTDHLNPAVAVTISAGFAVCGWIVQSRVALRNSAMQHTVNVLLQSRFSPVMKGYIDDLRDCFGDGPITRDDLDDPEKRKGIRAAIHLANFYEFLAIGIRRGDLLEEFLYETVRGQMVNLYDRVWPALEWQRSIDRRRPSRRYAALMDLARQWRTEHEQPSKQ